MGKARRALAITALVVVGIVFLAVLAVFVTTNTGWGREKVRRFALKMLNGRIHGRAQIGHVGGNLLTGLELADFSIVDSAGAPFLTADTVVTHYALRSRRSRWCSIARVARCSTSTDAGLSGWPSAAAIRPPRIACSSSMASGVSAVPRR